MMQINTSELMVFKQRIEFSSDILGHAVDPYVITHYIREIDDLSKKYVNENGDQ